MPAVDLRTTVHPQISWYIGKFFAEYPQLAQRSGRQVMTGVYVDNAAGNQFSEYGVSRATDYLLKIANTDVTVSGSSYGLDGVSLADGSTNSQSLLYLRELGDAVVDDEATLKRLLGVYDQEDENGEDWASAIAGASDRATRFATRLFDMTSVPSGAPSQDLGVLIAFLSRHFSYKRTDGTYFAKWSGTGRNFPQDTSPDYRQNALRELKLKRGEFYCYQVLTQEAAAGGGHPAVESVVQIDKEPGENSETARFRIVHQAARVENTPRSEFCFFYSHGGTNIAVPESARTALAPDLCVLLGHTAAAELPAYVEASSRFFLNDQQDDARLALFGVLKEGATGSGFPQGVEMFDPPEDDAGAAGTATTTESEDDEVDPADAALGRARAFACPADKVVELAAHADIESLTSVESSRGDVNEARTTLKHAQLLSKLGVTGGGEGVFVGVVDTGIDGDHPAFAGRIHRVWDMDASLNSNWPPPSGTGNNFGRVYTTRADIEAHSKDLNGHGTHVAGIAAGAAGTGYTNTGIASKAKLIIVRANRGNGRTFPNDRIEKGVRWIFREAGGTPCVVNMSLGGHANGHDGTDALALNVRQNVRRNNGSFRPGRILVGTSGNARASNGHVDVASIAANGTGTMTIRVQTAQPAPTRSWFLFYSRPIPRNVRGAAVDIRVRRASGAGSTGWIGPQADNHSTAPTIAGTLVGVSNGPPMPFTQHAHQQLQLVASPQIPAGNWTVDIRNRIAHPIEVHGYSLTALSSAGGQPIFFLSATVNTLIGSPGSANGIITVGSIVNRESWTPQAGGTHQNTGFVLDPATNLLTSQPQLNKNDISWSSCPGPVRGSSRTIEAMAPGNGVISARSSDVTTFDADDLVDANSVQMSGTSMAAPMITGLAAILLEKNPGMTYSQFRSKLRRAATAPSGWNTTTDGPGRLDASAL